MADSTKLLSNTCSFSTSANTVFNAGSALVTVTDITLITQRNASNAVIGSVVLEKGSYILRKGRDETFEANATIYATKVAL